MKVNVDGIEIKRIARWDKNGHYYHWDSFTQKKLDELVNKYGVDQITNDGILWLQW